MASIRLHGNKWQARVSRRGHNQQIKSFHTKLDAERWARSIEVEFDKGSYINLALAERTTFKELIHRYIDEVLPTMRGGYADVIRLQALARKPIALHNLVALTPQKIAQYRDQRLKEIKPSTVIRELACFSSIINHARREWGININNPVAMVKKPQGGQGRNRILSDVELNLILEELKPVDRRNIWMQPFVRLALETAMRRGELLSLQWAWINFEKRTATLPITKNGERRVVPLSSAAIEILSALPRSINGRVFPVTHEVVSQAFNRARKRAGVADIRIHDLRHMAITRIAEKLPNIIELSAVSGHKSLAMLRRYYHPNPEVLAEKLG